METLLTNGSYECYSLVRGRVPSLVFLPRLLTIREKTFTVPIIKHTFQNAGIWLVSFKAVKKKLKEYGRKSKKDTGLNLLEFGSESESESEAEAEDKAIVTLIPDLMLIEEYQLPRLNLASSYDECRRRNDELAPKILAAAREWSSPSCAKA
jgi:hypothetical protein